MVVALLPLCLLAPNADLQPFAHGPWEVRRGRTTDAATAGGYPTYTVTVAAAADGEAVTIEDPGGGGRGSILIGCRVTVPAEGLVTLDFRYTTQSEQPDRCGRWELAMLTPETWERLAREPQEAVEFNSADRAVCPTRVVVREQAGADVTEPVDLPASLRLALATGLRRLAGREVILAAVWTGLHGAVERATLQGLRVVTQAPPDPVRQVLAALDLERPELAPVKAAAERGDLAGAAEAIAAWSRQRTSPQVPGDPRRGAKEASKATLEEADAALANRFRGQPAYGLQQVPDDLDWSFNPTKDPEWTWQFNRHSAWQALARAYHATGDERYAECWVRLVRDWVKDNPPGTPWSWRTIEAGIRGSGWPMVYAGFVESPSLTPRDHCLFLAAVADHGDYLLPANRFSGGSNWGMIESQGLLRLGLYFPEFRAAPTWRETAWTRIAAEMDRQVLPDGSQVELTTGYHVGVLSMFQACGDLAKEAGFAPSDAYWQRLEKMYDYSACLTKPDGSQPMPGDSWPGSLRNLLVAGAKRYNRPDLLFIGTNGREGERPGYLDTAQRDAGYYVMRTGWTDDPQAIWVLCDVAHRWGGGHQHPDALQLDLFAYGATLLPDTGSYLYYGPGRAAASRTAAHNTVTIDGNNQNTSPCRLHSFASGRLLSFCDGEQSGYPGITNRRQVVLVRPAPGVIPYLLVVDRVRGEGRHAADQWFHFRPGPLAVEPARLAARTQATPGPNLLVQGLGAGATMVEEDSFVSFEYTKREDRRAVRFRREGVLPLTFVTLLVPYPEAAPAVQAWIVTEGDDQVVVKVAGPGFEDRLFVADLPLQPAGFEARGRVGLSRQAVGAAATGEVLDGGAEPGR